MCPFHPDPLVCFVSATQLNPTKFLVEMKTSCHFTMEVADLQESSKTEVGFRHNISLARQQPDLEIPPATSLRQ